MSDMRGQCVRMTLTSTLYNDPSFKREMTTEFLHKEKSCLFQDIYLIVLLGLNLGFLTAPHLVGKYKTFVLT